MSNSLDEFLTITITFASDKGINTDLLDSKEVVDRDRDQLDK